MSISGVGVSWTESDERSLCAECGCHYVYRCPCWERRLPAPVKATPPAVNEYVLLQPWLNGCDPAREIKRDKED